MWRKDQIYPSNPTVFGIVFAVRTGIGTQGGQSMRS